MMYRYSAMAAAVCLLAVAPARAQGEDDDLGWAFTGELTFVSSSGNAESETLGLGLELVRSREHDELSFAAGGLRAESTTTRRTAVVTADGFALIEDSDTALTAEHVYLRGRYQHDVSERLFWFTGAGFERNEFAGFTSRLSAVGGIGRTWFDTDRSHFRTDVGISYTSQDDVVESTGGTNDFLGLRLGYDYGRDLTETTTFTSKLVIDQNLDETDDLRADFLNAINVSMNELLSLKAGVQVMFDNLPALAEVPLVDAMGAPVGNVLVELDDIDTQLTVAVVFTR